jgi:16S rRNA (guanine966-N2)-methyltransferase
MRIIAGRFRGRRLASFDADHIRPTTDRVKESIFNKLQGYFDDARVLDLFSGTGNLAFEALSRGATFVEAVEMSRKSIAIIQKNIELLELEKSEIRVVCEDVLKYLRASQGPQFDVVLADPPFTKAMADEVLKALVDSKVVGLETIVMIEASSHETVEDRYESTTGDRLIFRPLVRFDQKDYGDKKVSYFSREEG